jgi:acetyl esterase/lipase
MIGSSLVRLGAAAVVACSGLCLIGSTSRATAVPAALTNLSYGPGPYETLSVYPAASPGARLVLLVHGGGWTSDVQNYGNTPTVASQMQAAGFTVVDVNYATDSVNFAALPLQISELISATNWALANATLYNGDPNHLSLVGLSAGGDLVASLSQALPPGAVKAVVTLSGAFDFTTLIPDYASGTSSLYLSRLAAVALGCRITTCSNVAETQWSPVDHVTPTNCPGTWLLYNSANEPMPMDQSAAMTASLMANGCSVTEISLPGTAHAYDYWNTVSSNVISTIQASG